MRFAPYSCSPRNLDNDKGNLYPAVNLLDEVIAIDRETFKDKFAYKRERDHLGYTL